MQALSINVRFVVPFLCGSQTCQSLVNGWKVKSMLRLYHFDVRDLSKGFSNAEHVDRRPVCYR